jgi:hypothetical protein
MAGYKLVNPGDEALAADVNGLYMSQTVPRFASASARTAAIAAPAVNQLSNLDTAKGAPDYYNGSAWVPLGVAYERFFYNSNTYAIANATDFLIASFAMPVSGVIIVQGILQVFPGTVAGATVAIVQASATSIPPATNAPASSGPGLAANAYYSPLPFVGRWANVAAGTNVTLNASARSSVPTNGVVFNSMAGTIRIIPAEF